MDTSLVMDIAVESLRVTVLGCSAYFGRGPHVRSTRWYFASGDLYPRNDAEFYSQIGGHDVGNYFVW